jgi:hypothetical protein
MTMPTAVKTPRRSTKITPNDHSYEKISLLVQTVEREMRTERSGWRATSDSMKKIKQAVAKINNKGEFEFE